MNNYRHFHSWIVKTRALIDGHFTFANEYHSRYYVNFDRVLTHPKITNEIVTLLYRPVSELDVSCVLTANATQGYVLAHSLAAKFNARALHAERRDGMVYPPSHCPIDRADKVLLVDDGINTGNSMKQLFHMVQETGATVFGITVCTLRYPSELSDFRVPVHGIFDLTRQYPLGHVRTQGCDQCRWLDDTKKRLAAVKDAAESKTLMRHKAMLEPRSPYADADLTT